MIANPAGVGNITDASLAKNLSHFRSEVKAFKEKNKILYQDRTHDSVSNRTLLANALESVAQNDMERNRIAEYKEKIAQLDAQEKKLRELNAQIIEI